MKRKTNRLPSRAALLVGLYFGTALIATVPKAFSQAFFVSIEPAGVENQQSPLVVRGQNYGAAGVQIENFDIPHTPPLISNQVQPLNFANNPAIGSYSSPTIVSNFSSNGRSGALVKSADVFGGADGTGNYMTVNIASGSTNRVSGGPSAPSTTITFMHPQRYFGLWWSAGDANNVLTFFSGSHELQTFHTSDVTNFIANSPTLTAAQKDAYHGNPNSQFKGQNSGENYAFLNFFAAPTNRNVTFDRVVLSNSLTTGFESDNHTIAASYEDTTGTEIPPGPGEPETPIEPGPGQRVDLGRGTVATETGTGHLDGTLDIDAGAMLMVDGGKVIDPPGDLEGEGDIMTPEVDNNGTVEPGSGEGRSVSDSRGPGDLTVHGNYNQGPRGTLKIGIAGAQCPDGSRLVVTGTATLDGTLDLVSLNNFHATSDSHYTVLIAFRGVSGFFSNVTDTFDTSGLTRADIMAPNGVVVAYLPAGHGVLTLRSAEPIPIDSPCDVDPVLVSALAPNASELTAPFEVWYGLAQQQKWSLQDHFDDIMAAPVPVPPPPPPQPKQVIDKNVISGKEALPPPAPVPEKRWNLWASGYGNWTDLNSIWGYHFTNAGVLIGADYRLLDHFIIGLVGGYGHSGDTVIDGSTGWGGLYAGYYNKGFYVLGAAYGGAGSLDTSRSNVIGSRNRGSADTQEWATFVSLGYDAHFGGLVIGPTFSASYMYSNLSSFTEQGFAPLRVNETSSEDYRTDLGFRAWYALPIGQIQLRPFVRAVWEHAYKGRLAIPVSLIDFDTAPIVVSTQQPGHDSAVVNAGVSAQITPTISINVSYDGNLGRDNFSSNGVSGGFNISF